MLLFKDVPEKPPGPPAPTPGTAPANEAVTREPEKRPLRCVRCKAEITDEAHRISVDGSHEHTRLNPLAVAFRFGCFATASCEVAGDASTEHTWFTGCAWQYALCPGCGVHLGWFFSGAQSFFGLLLDRLSSEARSSSDGS